jgi:demethylmenaquinone methyltransferase/2-methoxy-6-polyprenyl-1,4-benzoquinol methylase
MKRTNSAQQGQIREMFGRIAPRYDFLNRLLSFGIDKRWRRAAAEKIPLHGTSLVLDIATGTGDMALEEASLLPSPVKIVGVDFCEEMVALAKEKISSSRHQARIDVGIASCEALPFRENTFDAASISFGIRNVVDRERGLREILRVLRPGGRLVILEFSQPTSACFRTAYYVYFRRILPAIGGFFSDFGSYRYLPDSVLDFPDRDEFTSKMTGEGFTAVSHTDLSGGIVTVYAGVKPVISS